MATVQYFDALGATQALDLVGESGMLPLEALGGAYPNITSIDQDDGSRSVKSMCMGQAMNCCNVGLASAFHSRRSLLPMLCRYAGANTSNFNFIFQTECASLRDSGVVQKIAGQAE